MEHTKVRDLPKEIVDIVLLRAASQGKKDVEEVLDDTIISAFTWSATPEGSILWAHVYRGEYELFYEYHKEQEPELEW